MGKILRGSDVVKCRRDTRYATRWGGNGGGGGGGGGEGDDVVWARATTGKFAVGLSNARTRFVLRDNMASERTDGAKECASQRRRTHGRKPSGRTDGRKLGQLRKGEWLLVPGGQGVFTRLHNRKCGPVTFVTEREREREQEQHIWQKAASLLATSGKFHST